MTKLHIALTGLQDNKFSNQNSQNQSSQINVVVWENGEQKSNVARLKTSDNAAFSIPATLSTKNILGLNANSDINIFDLIKKRKTNENYIERISLKISSLTLALQANANKLKTLQVTTSSIDTQLIYLDAAVHTIDERYKGYLVRAKALKEKVMVATALAGNINEAKLFRLETALNQLKKAIDYLNNLRDTANNYETDLASTQIRTNSAANKASILVSTIKNRIDDYNKLLVDIDRRISAIKKLSINVSRNAFSSEFMLDVVARSFTTLQEKQEQRQKKVKEFTEVLTFLITFCGKVKIEIDLLEIELNDLWESFNITSCNFEDKTEMLDDIEKQCDLASATLDEYFDLFIGCNFMAAGKNIRLNREGCSCVITAVQPELPACPQVPLTPSIPADVSIKEGELPICPPQMCIGTFEPPPPPPQPTQPDPTQPDPTQPQPTQPEPTQPDPTQPQPTQPKIHSCRMHTSGSYMTIKTYNSKIPGYYTKAFEPSVWGEITENGGDFPDNLVSFPNTHKWTYDSIAVPAGVTITVWSGKNFTGNIVLKETGPVIINNSDCINDPVIVKSLADPEVTAAWRFIFKSGMHDWAHGSTRLEC